MTEEADNGGFLSHSTGLFLDNSMPSFQEYAPRETESIFPPWEEKCHQ